MNMYFEWSGKLLKTLNIVDRGDLNAEISYYNACINCEQE